MNKKNQEVKQPELMSWKEAEDQLVEMFPPESYTVCMSPTIHTGCYPFSGVIVSVYPNHTIGNSLYYAADSGTDPWKTVVDSIRQQLSHDKLPDMCAYCNQIMDGETCFNLECDINLPEAA